MKNSFPKIHNLDNINNLYPASKSDRNQLSHFIRKSVSTILALDLSGTGKPQPLNSSQRVKARVTERLFNNRIPREKLLSDISVSRLKKVDKKWKGISRARSMRDSNLMKEKNENFRIRKNRIKLSQEREINNNSLKFKSAGTLVKRSEEQESEAEPFTIENIVDDQKTVRYGESRAAQLELIKMKKNIKKNDLNLLKREYFTPKTRNDPITLENKKVENEIIKFTPPYRINDVDANLQLTNKILKTAKFFFRNKRYKLLKDDNRLKGAGHKNAIMQLLTYKFLKKSYHRKVVLEVEIITKYQKSLKNAQKFAKDNTNSLLTLEQSHKSKNRINRRDTNYRNILLVNTSFPAPAYSENGNRSYFEHSEPSVNALDSINPIVFHQEVNFDQEFKERAEDTLFCYKERNELGFIKMHENYINLKLKPKLLHEIQFDRFFMNLLNLNQKYFHFVYKPPKNINHCFNCLILKDEGFEHNNDEVTNFEKEVNGEIFLDEVILRLNKAKSLENKLVELMIKLEIRKHFGSIRSKYLKLFLFSKSQKNLINFKKLDNIESRVLNITGQFPRAPHFPSLRFGEDEINRLFVKEIFKLKFQKILNNFFIVTTKIEVNIQKDPLTGLPFVKDKKRLLKMNAIKYASKRRFSSNTLKNLDNMIQKKNILSSNTKLKKKFFGERIPSGISIQKSENEAGMSLKLAIPMNKTRFSASGNFQFMTRI